LDLQSRKIIIGLQKVNLSQTKISLMRTPDLGNESYNFLTKTYSISIFNYYAKNDYEYVYIIFFNDFCVLLRQRE